MRGNNHDGRKFSMYQGKGGRLFGFLARGRFLRNANRIGVGLDGVLAATGVATGERATVSVFLAVGFSFDDELESMRLNARGRGWGIGPRGSGLGTWGPGFGIRDTGLRTSCRLPGFALPPVLTDG